MRFRLQRYVFSSFIFPVLYKFRYLELAIEINTTEAFTNMANKEGSQTTVWQFLEQRWNDISKELLFSSLKV